MAINDGSLTDPDEVMNAIGSNFNDNAQLIYNADYIGFDARLSNNTTPSLKNIDYDTFTSDSMTDSGEVYYVASSDTYIGGEFDNVTDFTTFDDCDDSSVDGAKWTTSTALSGSSVTEDSTSQIVASGSTAVQGTVTSTSISLSPALGSVLTFNVPFIDANGNGGGLTTTTTISLGSATLISLVDAGGGTSASDLKFQAMRVARGYYWRKYDSTWGDWSFVADTSAANLVFYVNKFGGNITGSGNIQFNSVRFITDQDAGTGTLISDTVTADSTITNLISTWNSTSSTNSVDVTADGTNYESVTKNTIHRPSNTGTSLKIKFTFESFSELSEYATKYNFY